ncbi:cob(I)yrinic acid a,c-diamide adenosyltransferase [Candidatus Aenigmatarchaeota archaeon]
MVQRKVRKKTTNEMGLIHVYTGDGKGKSTASFGLALRAIGHGYKAYVIQFMKGGRFFGELITAEKYLKRKLLFAQFGQSAPFEKDIRKGKLKPNKELFLPLEDDQQISQNALKFAEKIIKSKKYGLIVLDEINVAISMGHLKIEDVLKIMMSKPKNVELVLTGRNAPESIKDAADYVNEIIKIKHPFDKKKKIVGRRGVEY